MSNLVVVQLTDDIQHVQLTNGMIQRSFDRYEIESDEELQDDYTADIQRSLDESKLSIQRFDRYEIESDEELQDDYTADIQRSIEIDKEEYWYSVEQERMKEEYLHLVEQLELEYGADIPTEDHPLIISTTLSIILEIELDDKQELDLQVDDESFKKMICNIYPQVCDSGTTCINSRTTCINSRTTCINSRTTCINYLY